MELQAAAPARTAGGLLADADLVTSTVDVPTLILKDVRAEAARITLAKPVVSLPAEEVIVPDLRAGVTPAQAVERKLVAMLQGGAAIPASHFRLARLCRQR
jgi:hypothetical protein